MTVLDNCLSIVIVSFNSEHYLQRALNSIRKYNDIEKCEVVIVDNSTRDIDCSFLSDYSFSIKFINSQENLGFGVANNLGVRSSSYKNILLLNLDAQVKCELSKIVSSIKYHPNCLIGAIMSDDDDQYRPSFGTFPNSLLKVIFPSKMYSLPLQTSTFEVDWIEASFLALSKETWGSIGGFDPDIFMYGEDLVFCKTANNLGIRSIVDITLSYSHTGGYDDSKYGNIYLGIKAFLRVNVDFRSRLLAKALFLSLFLKFILFSVMSLFDNSCKVKSKSLNSRFFK